MITFSSFLKVASFENHKTQVVCVSVERKYLKNQGEQYLLYNRSLYTHTTKQYLISFLITYLFTETVSF